MEQFSIVVTYEDMFTHNRVREVCDRLLDQFWGELEFDINWWSFKSLRDAEAARAAAGAASDANLIVVSSHAGNGLPAHIQRWMDLWVDARRTREGALAALIGFPEEKGALPIIAYLQHIAQRARLDFLPNAAAAHSADAVSQKMKPRSTKRLVTEDLQRILDPRRPPPHWGINE